MLSGKDLAEEDEEVSSFEAASADTERRVAYNPSIPIESFDLVITDECHRSIYGTWRQALECFYAFTVGLTATPSLHRLGFFGRNLVAQYPYERLLRRATSSLMVKRSGTSVIPDVSHTVSLTKMPT